MIPKTRYAKKRVKKGAVLYEGVCVGGDDHGLPLVRFRDGIVIERMYVTGPQIVDHYRTPFFKNNNGVWGYYTYDGGMWIWG